MKDNPMAMSAAELAEVQARREAEFPLITFESHGGELYVSGSNLVPLTRMLAQLRTDIPRLLKTIEARETQRVIVHVGKSCLTRDLVWCECGRGLSRNGKWEFCPQCGGRIDQESYARATKEAMENGRYIARYTDPTDAELIRDLETQRDGLLAALKECIGGFYGGQPGYITSLALQQAKAAIAAAGDHDCHPAPGKQP